MAIVDASKSKLYSTFQEELKKQPGNIGYIEFCNKTVVLINPPCILDNRYVIKLVDLFSFTVAHNLTRPLRNKVRNFNIIVSEVNLDGFL